MSCNLNTILMQLKKNLTYVIEPENLYTEI